jgi:hypothetical protein
MPHRCRYHTPRSNPGNTAGRRQAHHRHHPPRGPDAHRIIQAVNWASQEGAGPGLTFQARFKCHCHSLIEAIADTAATPATGDL